MACHEPSSLFDACVRVVLKSSVLTGKAATELPLKISQFILYKACKHRDDLSVQRIIENWPHSELSFDFLSNPLCTKHKLRVGCCWGPNLYYGVFHESLELEPCVSSILRGVFQKVYQALSQGTPISLQLVSLKSLLIEDKKHVEALCKLLEGEFPATHPADYLSERDSKALNQLRPHFPPLLEQVGLVKLHVNIELNTALKKEMFSSASEKSGVFEVVLKGLSSDLEYMCSLHPADVYQLEYLMVKRSKHFRFVDFERLISLIESSNDFKCLGLCRSIFNEIVDHMTDSDYAAKALLVEIDGSGGRHGPDYYVKLSALLHRRRQSLEYLQLKWTSLISMELDVLCLCQNLRVLSVSFRSYGSFKIENSPAEVFKMIGQLPNLEFFEWFQNVNLQTKDILSLRESLCDSLPKLSHFHVYLGEFLLSTTDLMDVKFAPIMALLLAFLSDKHGDESCTTYKFYLNHKTFAHWVVALRPDVCFKMVGFYCQLL